MKNILFKKEFDGIQKIDSLKKKLNWERSKMEDMVVAMVKKTGRVSIKDGDEPMFPVSDECEPGILGHIVSVSPSQAKAVIVTVVKNKTGEGKKELSSVAITNILEQENVMNFLLTYAPEDVSTK